MHDGNETPIHNPVICVYFFVSLFFLCYNITQSHYAVSNHLEAPHASYSTTTLNPAHTMQHSTMVTHPVSEVGFVSRGDHKPFPPRSHGYATCHAMWVHGCGFDVVMHGYGRAGNHEHFRVPGRVFQHGYGWYVSAINYLGAKG